MLALGLTEVYCQACFTGRYPIEVDLESIKTGFEKSFG